MEANMARSFKKTPGWCDRNPWAKREANKRVRRYKGDLPKKGNVHRKLFQQWTICDWKDLYFTERQLRDLERGWWYAGRYFDGTPRYKVTRK
jgi:hypothetical protein